MRHSRPAVAGAVAVAVLSGVFTAVQTRINSQFARELGDGVLSAFISFGSGMLVLALIVGLTPAGRRGLARLRESVASGRTPWWYLIGGVGGALFVLGQGLSAGILGVALFTIVVVASQTVSGTVIDRVGVGALGQRPITPLRIAASALAVLAVAFAGIAELRFDVPPWVLILPLVAGVAIGWQQAANGQVRHVAQSAVAATFVNFLTGTAVLLVAALIHSSATGWPQAFPTNPLLYSGGFLGVVFVFGAIAVVRFTGVLLLGLGTIAGQLLGALVLDLVLPVSGHAIALTTVIGTLLTLVAVSIAAFATRATASSGASRA